MKILIFALLAAAAGQTVAPERVTHTRDISAFSLLPAQKCEEAHDVGWCHVSYPKAWSADARQVIQDSMRRLSADALVRGLLVGARENGYDGLRRYATYAEKNPTLGPVPKFTPGFVLYTSKVIGITDAFFQTYDVTDPISDYRFGDLILVHELVHAFDDRKLSSTLGFTSMTGWVLRDSRWEYRNRVPYSAYLNVYADTLTLNARGRYFDAWTRDRSFATSLTFPVPTIQSLASPDESFADILAHLLVDRRATSYLKPQVARWFEDNVFPALVEQAHRFRPADYDLF